MANAALRPPPKGVHRLTPRRRRHPRVLGAHATEAISVAGLVGSEVLTVSSHAFGRLEDIVVRWDELHPPVVGALVRRGREHTLVRSDDFAALYRVGLVVREHPKLASSAVQAPCVRLARDVLDRQIVDIDGADVVRVSDLALVPADGGFRLAGVDISARTLLRRAGPASLRRRIAPDRLYDWADVAAVGAPSSDLHLTTAAAALRAHGAAGLGALLDGPGR
jgi:magnesium transporter